MDELRELYQQVILDHNSAPRNFKKPDHPTHSCEGYNPLCGDRFNIFLDIEDDVIKDIGFQGSGCAISKASASVMTTLVKGKSMAHAKKLFNQFQKLIKGEAEMGSNGLEEPRLAVFAGVREFPARVKCAALAWHTLISAMQDSQKVVSTE